MKIKAKRKEVKEKGNFRALEEPNGHSYRFERVFLVGSSRVFLV